ncbi:MAG TPA: hypothetical protein VJR02_04145 [Pyrinomonadaceae bacterium]|nr:hypothetical protein [Pyrinomonadaceae bacterium]
MNSTGNKKSGYLVALLLVVGLAAFSNSMRELAEIHRFTFDTSRLIAHYVAPAEIPQLVVAKLDSCDSRQAVPSVEVEWLEDVEGITEPGVQLTVPAPPVKVERVAPRVRVKPTEIQLAKVDKLRQFEFHATPFEFKIAADDNDSDAPVPVQLPMTMFKAKNRKHNNVFRLSTRDREMILKTLNRSINLRTAS